MIDVFDSSVNALENYTRILSYARSFIHALIYTGIIVPLREGPPYSPRLGATCHLPVVNTKKHSVVQASHCSLRMYGRTFAPCTQMQETFTERTDTTYAHTGHRLSQTAEMAQRWPVGGASEEE